jgi:ABC-2 type transport system permease protein
LRFNALPLYFSRPLRRVDYFAGKFGIVAAFLGVVTVVPSVVAYLLGLLLSLDFTILRDTFMILVDALAYGAIIALSTGLLILALSSLSRNSRYVVLLWLGVWFLSGIMSSVLEATAREQERAAEFRQLNENPKLTSWQRRQGFEKIRAAELKAERTDWRQIVSYTANLDRIGRQILGTDAAWELVSQFEPPGYQERFVLNHTGAQYPWEWSALVLAGLCGVSLCILSLKIRSLDRLK